MKRLITALLHYLVGRIITQYQPTIIGVTGNVGKTSMRNSLVSFLSQFTSVTTNYQNYNTEIGIPLSILGCTSPGKNIWKWLAVLWQGWVLSLGKKNDISNIWVIEVGIDHPGDMDKIISFLPFDIIVFGSVGEYPVHAENFSDRDALIYEKSKILRGLKEEGQLIINADDPFIEHLYQKRRGVMTFGFTDKAFLRASDFTTKLSIRDTEEQWETYGTALVPQATCKISYQGSTVPFYLDFVLGKHQMYTVLPTIALGLIEDMNLVDISQNMPSPSPIPGRMYVLEGAKDSLLIDDSYNAAPAAVFASLDSLAHCTVEGARKIAILGDMKELGDQSQDIHYQVGVYAGSRADIVIGVGEESQYMIQGFQSVSQGSTYHFDISEEAADCIEEMITSQDIVLVKGSQAMRMERVSSRILANKRYRSDVLPRQKDEWLEKI